MKQTAVEWLVEQLKTMDTKSFNRLIQIEMSRENFEECFEQAKELEKQQIQDAYLDGYCETAEDSQDYYSKTYSK